MSRTVLTGYTYKHFKGGIYVVVGEATHTETQEQLVIYHSIDERKSLYAPKLFARPLDIFLSEVDFEKYPNAKQKYRMELID
ncbi:DUF1653 domain-containing protein [Enterococcus gilvus]|uniref:DUF1653 domain-containing protein n=1 Tax=Enterococcus gilvus TaxID=160453 RepID=UPI003D6A10EF